MASSTVMGLHSSLRRVSSGRRFSSTWVGTPLASKSKIVSDSPLDTNYCGGNLLATPTPSKFKSRGGNLLATPTPSKFKSCGGNQGEFLTPPKPPMQTEPSSMLLKLEEDLGYDGGDGPLHWPSPLNPDSYWYDYDDKPKEYMKGKFGEKQTRLLGSVAVLGIQRRKSTAVFGCEPSLLSQCPPARPSGRTVNKKFDDFKIHSPSAKVSKVDRPSLSLSRGSRVIDGRGVIPPTSNGRHGCFGLSANKNKSDGGAMEGFDGDGHGHGHLGALPLPEKTELRRRPRLCDEIRKKLSQLRSEYIYVPTVGLGASIEHLIGLDEFDGREGIEPPTVCTCIIPKNAVFSTQMPMRLVCV